MTLPERPATPDSQPGAGVERWAQIRGAVEAALALSPEARLDFVERASGGDVELRASIEALLHACERASGPALAFLSEPASAFAAPLLEGFTEEAPGESSDAPLGVQEWAGAPDAALAEPLSAALAGRYEVGQELGRGGAATVYLARDLRHGRRVAIKVLDRVLGAALSAERFLREIRVTAGLVHPHILPLHDSGETAGLLYYVMPYVEGETLRDRLARNGSLPVNEAVQVLREVADALAYAHGRGVVHRDIKPANILLHGSPQNQHALLADFGIARAVRRAREDRNPLLTQHAEDGGTDDGTDTLTAAGSSPGTPAYMAPEQANGNAVDERADLYALGVVAYEALAGAHPFTHGDRRTPRALPSAQQTGTPPALIAQRPEVPPALDALVMRLLARDPASRPRNAQEVLNALRAMDPLPAITHVAQRRRSAALAALLLALGAAGYGVWRLTPATANPRGSTLGAATAVHALAVLPFVNTSGEPEDNYFSDGLTDELAHALTQLPYLRLAGRSSSYAFKGRNVPARDVGRALGVDAIVEGTVRRTRDRLRVTAQLVTTTDGTVRWDSVYETTSRDMFAVQDALTRSITAALAPALRARAAGSEDRAADVERGTSDQEAYDLFLKGRYNFLLRNPTRLARAVTYFRQAIARDPSFARAHAGLAMTYVVLPTYFPGARDSAVALAAASAERALALDSTLADAHVAAGGALGLQLRFRDAVAHYRAGLARDPSSVTGHFWLGIALLNLGRTDDALVELRLATQLDPLAHSAAAAVAKALLFARRFPEAAGAARHALAIDSTFSGSILQLGLAEAFGGQPDSAIRTLEHGLRSSPGNPELTSALVFAYAAAGHWADAARLRERLHRPGGDPSGGFDAAIADMVFGDREPALRLLSPDAHGRPPHTLGTYFGCDPLLDPLRSDARFRAAMRSLGVESCTLARPWPIPPRPPRSSPSAAMTFPR